MLDDENAAAVGAPVPVFDAFGRPGVYFRAPLTREPSTDDAAVWRIAAHLQLQHAAILEDQLENLAVLRDGW